MLEQFYRDVLPEEGHYALFIGPTRQHVWANTIEELVQQTEARNDTPDVYFATAAYEAPINRKAENVRALRAFRFDIDAGEVKYEKYGDQVYASQNDALAGLVAFSKAAKLLPSYVVSSGAGLHVYYCLDEDVLPAAWVPAAQRLQEVAVEHGLRVDSKVTGDAARVLRPIGGLHSSGSRVALVHASGRRYTLSQVLELLGAPKRKYDLSINKEAMEEPPIGPPSSVIKIVEHCPAMAHATSEPNIPEPFWRGMLGVVKHTVEGDEAAHRFSEDYPDYSYDETQRKLDNWKTGPTTCQEFSHHFPGCRTCPHWTKIKSPISLGRMNVEEVKELPPEKQPVLVVPPSPLGHPWDDKIPEPFFIRDSFALCKREMADNGSQYTIPVTSTPFWFESWAEFAGDGDTSQVEVHSWNGKAERTFSMDLTLMGSPSDCTKFFAGKGIILAGHGGTKKAMDEYLKAQMERIRTMHMRPKVNDRFGLRIEPDGSLVAVHGRYIIKGDGTVTAAMLSGEVARRGDHFEIAQLRGSKHTSWGPEIWPDIRAAALRYVEFVRKYYDHQDLAQFKLALMFILASPLMPFVTGEYKQHGQLPANGLSVSLYSHESARGKTSVARVGMTAFGDHTQLVKARDERSITENARRAVLSAHGTLPVVMDEMGEADAKLVANMVSAVANGAARERRDYKYGTEPPWALINIITCNVPQRDLINQAREASDAIQFRLLELDVSKLPDRPEELAAAFDTEFGTLREKAQGALGAWLHLMYCRLGVEKLNEEIQRNVAAARKLTHNSQEARFQWRAFGAVLTVQQFLERMGLEMFNRNELIDAFKDAFLTGTDYVKENTLPITPSDVMSMALSDMRPFTLITDTETHRGRNPNARDLVRNIGGAPKIVHARAVQKGSYVYVSVDALKVWCQRKNVAFNTLVKDCQKADVFMRMGPDVYRGRVDLFKGTDEDGVGAPVSVYKVNAQMLNQEEVNYHENVVPLHIAREQAPDYGPQLYEEKK